MGDTDHSACWLHLTCERCGGIHAVDEPCQTRAAVPIPRLTAPARGTRQLSSTELRAIMLVLEPGAETAVELVDHDDALTIVAGSGVLTISRSDQELSTPPTSVDLLPGTIAVVPAGSRRTVAAGPAGLTFSSVQRRRD
jgi:quercetin dioxygenase-like cupin family protein